MIHRESNFGQRNYKMAHFPFARSAESGFELGRSDSENLLRDFLSESLGVLCRSEMRRNDRRIERVRAPALAENDRRLTLDLGLRQVPVIEEKTGSMGHQPS